MNELALFAGAGGGILGGHLLGWRTVCAVEYNAYARSVLLARQNDGTFPPFPIWDDVCTFDGKPWRGIVDVVSGGFPCQDISAAGKGAGLDGERSGLWSEMARIIREVQPRFVFVENSPMLTSRGLGVVLGDLATMGFDAEWGVLSAADTGAPHLRERIWILAHTQELQCDGGDHDSIILMESKAESKPGNDSRSFNLANTYREYEHRSGVKWQAGRIESTNRSSENMADTMREREQRIIPGVANAQEWRESSERPNRSRGNGFGRWPTESGLDRVAHGVANRADRLKAIGNGQVPRVVAAAWRILSHENA